MPLPRMPMTGGRNRLLMCTAWAALKRSYVKSGGARVSRDAGRPDEVPSLSLIHI